MTVVYTEMSGALFHSGHVSFLQACKQLGDVLLVGVRRDEPCVPYPNARVIGGCRFVDRVIADCPSPIDRAFIERHGIDVVVRGLDAPRSNHYEVPSEMGIVRSASVSDHDALAIDARLALTMPHATLQQTRIEQMLERLERATKGG